MERDFMGLDSKKTIVKKEFHQGCKEPDGFKAFNNHQEFRIQGAHLQQLHHDTKQSVPMFISSPFFRPVLSAAPVDSQFLKGVPVSSFPFIPWYNSKAASASTQLTMFYGGMVNVYDGISPEKAQAIMFLAGNGAFMATANAPQPCSVSSTMSVSSHHPVGGPPNKNEAAERVMSSFGQALQSAVPQARKASLARFLEKRKERMMASSPYSINKNTMDCNAAVIASK